MLKTLLIGRKVTVEFLYECKHYRVINVMSHHVRRCHQSIKKVLPMINFFHFWFFVINFALFHCNSSLLSWPTEFS